MRRKSRAVLLAALALLLPAVDAAASIGTSAGGRVQSAFVRDSNVFEATLADSIRTGYSLRLLGEGRVDARGLPLGSRAALTVRALAESFRDHPSEDRRQGEAEFRWELTPSERGSRLALDAGYSRRAYPDSSARGHHRSWARLTGVIPAGPHGSLVGRGEAWQLDFRVTPRVDRVGGVFDLSYEHPLDCRFVIVGGFELATVHHGLKSLRLVQGVDPPVTEFGSDRRDHGRFLHAGFRRQGRVLVHFQAGYRVQASNSIDGAFHRREATWLISSPLAWGVLGQFYGNLEHTTYTEKALRDFFVTRVGDIEAGDDDNTVALRLVRGLGSSWDLDGRLAWYRNQAPLVGVYYRKAVLSIGLSKRFGSSAF